MRCDSVTGLPDTLSKAGSRAAAPRRLCGVWHALQGLQRRGHVVQPGPAGVGLGACAEGQDQQQTCQGHHVTSISTLALCSKPLSPAQRTVMAPLATATVWKASQGLAAMAG